MFNEYSPDVGMARPPDSIFQATGLWVLASALAAGPIVAGLGALINAVT